MPDPASLSGGYHFFLFYLFCMYVYLRQIGIISIGSEAKEKNKNVPHQTELNNTNKLHCISQLTYPFVLEYWVTELKIKYFLTKATNVSLWGKATGWVIWEECHVTATLLMTKHKQTDFGQCVNLNYILAGILILSSSSLPNAHTAYDLNYCRTQSNKKDNRFIWNKTKIKQWLDKVVFHPQK